MISPQELSNLPTDCALFVSDDQTAVVVSRQCDALGLRLPEDLAVLSVDNDEIFADALVTNLSSIELDGERVGWEAAALLDRLRTGKAKPAEEPILIPPIEVVERRSTDRYAVESKRLRQALGIVARQAWVGLTPDDLAERMQVSRRTLENEFARELGHSVHEHIRIRQVDMARKLLRTETVSLEQISRECGFASVLTFKRNFLKSTKETPLAYRERFLL